MKFLKILFVFACILEAQAMVVGSDSRLAVPTNAPWPLNTIGRVRGDNDKFCTGTLVSRNVVMTARHCLVGGFTFTFQLPGQTPRTVTNFSLGDAIHHPYVNDVAFLRLELSLDYWSGTAPLQNSGGVVPGYDARLGDKLYVNTRECQVQRISDHGLLIHDCPTGDGTSGAPVFQKNANGETVIVGVNVAEAVDHGTCARLNSTNCYNVAVPFSQFFPFMTDFVRESDY